MLGSSSGGGSGMQHHAGSSSSCVCFLLSLLFSVFVSCVMADSGSSFSYYNLLRRMQHNSSSSSSSNNNHSSSNNNNNNNNNQHLRQYLYKYNSENRNNNNDSSNSSNSSDIQQLRLKLHQQLHRYNNNNNSNSNNKFLRQKLRQKLHRYNTRSLNNNSKNENHPLHRYYNHNNNNSNNNNDNRQLHRYNSRNSNNNSSNNSQHLRQQLYQQLQKFSNHNRNHRKFLATKRPKFPIEPSDSLPVNLDEKPNKENDPQEENLKPDILRKLLGGFFVDEFMSVDQPEESVTNPNGTLALRFQRGYPAGRRPQFVARFGRINWRDESGRRFREMDLDVAPEVKRKVAKFIRTHTFCPVIYKWKDLGIRFWPRWIKEGQCHQRGRSCSLPPGMRCKPSYSQSILLLRFHCWPDTKSCDWIQAQYPIISACRCEC